MDTGLRETARQHYTDLPYHNWQHVQDALAAAEELLDRCSRHDIDVDATVVRHAVLFHDADYHRDPGDAGHATKEEMSAAIAAEELRAAGHDEDHIEAVRDCILATEDDGSYDSPEQKIVRAADLSGLMADYETFRENAELLRAEHRQLHGEELSEQDWVDQVTGVLETYLAQDIRLTPEHDEDGLSEFHRRAGQNLGLFLEEHG